MKTKSIIKKTFNFFLDFGPLLFVVIWCIIAACYMGKEIDPPPLFLLSAIIGAIFFCLIGPLIRGNDYFEYVVIQVVIAIIILLIILVFGIVAGAIWPSLPIPWRLR